MNKQRTLSKSNYKLGLTCPKSLWIKLNHPEKLSEIDKGTQRRFDEGNVIGNLAKQLYSNGIEIKSFKYSDVVIDTNNELDKRVPLFEAGFMFNECFTRPDILNPIGKDEWEVIEVKSGTSVKKDHIEDSAFQKYVYENVGLKIKKYYIMFLNNEYVKDGDIDIDELFVKQDITDEVEKAYEGIEDRIKSLLELINLDSYDETKYGKHCDSPKTCPMPEEDWNELTKDNVFTLYYGGKKIKTLYKECEVMELKDIPARIKLSYKQKIQVDCVKSNKVHIDRTNINNFLDTLDFPLFHLDFETFQSGIPLYDGSKSFQQIPFQFSLHIQQKDNDKLEHHEFLADGKKDPRIKFIEKLKKHIGNTGSIVTYNKSFEMSVMRKIGEFLPQYQKWIKELEPRYIDLLDVFRNFWYYNPSQRGSCSIKKTLTALVPDMSYQDMFISNGGDASLEYFYSIFKYTNDEQIDNIRNHLLLYCGQDTLAMVKMIEELEKLVES